MPPETANLIRQAVQRSQDLGRILPPPHFVPTHRLSSESLEKQAQRLNEAEAIAQVGSFHWDPATDTVTWSDQHYHNFGVSPEAFQPTYQAYLQLVHPADLPDVVATINGVLAERTGATHEYRIVWPSGEVRWIRSRLRVTVDHLGQVAGVYGTCQDITSVKLRELMLASEHKVMQLILARCSLRQIIHEIALGVEQQADDMRCAIFLMNPESNVVRLQAAPSMSEHYRQATASFTIHPNAGTCGPAIYQRALCFTEDVLLDQNWQDYLEVIREDNVRAAWSAPILCNDGKVHGTVTVFCANPRKPGARERQVMDRAISMAMIAIERDRTERELLESQQRYKLATQAGRVTVWEFNLQTNRGYAEFDWQGTPDFPGRGGAFELENWLKIIHPDDLPRLLADVERSFEPDGPPLEIEHRVVSPLCEVRWVLARGTIERDAQAQPLRLVGTSTDITERKLAEQEIDRLNQFYRVMIDTAAEGICAFRVDPDSGMMRFVLWNERMTRITGIAALKTFPHSWDVTYPFQPHLRPLGELLRQISFERDWRGRHVQYLHADGRERTLSISTSRVTDIDSATTVVALVQDVTERARAERAACENEARFLQFASSIPHALWMFSADGSRHFYVNPAFERMFSGVSRSLLSDPYAWVNALHPNDAGRVSQWLHSGLHASATLEVRLHPRFGDNRWLNLLIIPIFAQPDLPSTFVGLAEEITALKRAEEQRDQTQSQLGSVTQLQALGEMVAGIAHELAQPLTAIQNFAAACVELSHRDEQLRHAMPDEMRHYLQEVVRQATRAGRIFSGFRNLSRRRPPQRELVPLNQLVSDTLNLMSAELRRRQIQVEVCLPQPAPQLSVDCVQMQQVLVNLLRNAADAMEHLPAAERRVGLSACLAEDKVLIACADNGPGLGEIDDTTLFRPFYTTKADGTGMGLPICRSIVEGHGGTITFRNGQTGAVFEITIPLT